LENAILNIQFFKERGYSKVIGKVWTGCFVISCGNSSQGRLWRSMPTFHFGRQAVTAVFEVDGVGDCIRELTLDGVVVGNKQVGFFRKVLLHWVQKFQR